MNFFEALKKPFYAKKEVDLERSKNPSTTSKVHDIESDTISYDPFAMYTNGNIFQQVLVGIGNYNEMIRKWREMALLPEVDEALSEIVDEAIVYEEDNLPIELDLEEIEMSDKIKDKMIESFEKIMYMLDFNSKGDDLFRQWYVDGTLNVESVYDNNNLKNGINKLIKLAPYNFVKFKDEKSGETKYYIHRRPSYNYLRDLESAEDVFTEEQITQITTGVWSADKRVALSPLNKAMKSINQLYLIEDSLVVYRITRSPEKRVFYVDTGNLPKTKAEEYISSLIRKYRQKKVYNTETGTVDNKNKSISVLEDFWFSVNSQGRGTKVDTLQSAGGGFADMADLEYFVGKVYKSLHVPVGRRNTEGRIVLNNTIDIEKDEIKFFKYVSKLRRKFNDLFVDLMKKDLLAKQVFTIQDWKEIQEKIKFKYANTNPYAEIKKLQIVGMRMEAANNASALVDQGYFSKGYVKREILSQTEEEIKKIEKEREKEMEKEAPPVGFSPEEDPDQQNGFPGNGAPTKKKFQMKKGGPPQAGDQPDEKPPVEDDQIPKPVKLNSGLAGINTDDLAAVLEAIVRKVVDEKFGSTGIRKEILDNLKEGDVISDGTRKMIFRGGQLHPVGQ